MAGLVIFGVEGGRAAAVAASGLAVADLVSFLRDLTCDRLVRTWIAGWARLRSRVALAKSSAVAGRLSRDVEVASVHDPSAGCSGQGRSLGWMERARALPVRGQGFSHLEQ